MTQGYSTLRSKKNAHFFEHPKWLFDRQLDIIFRKYQLANTLRWYEYSYL